MRQEWGEGLVFWVVHLSCLQVLGLLGCTLSSSSGLAAMELAVEVGYVTMGRVTEGRPNLGCGFSLLCCRKKRMKRGVHQLWE